jgi:hypothetical protein
MSLDSERLDIQLKIKRELAANLTQLRSLASQYRAMDERLNEEEVFEKFLTDLSSGVKMAMSELVGVTKTARLLDPFNGRINKKAKNRVAEE